MAHWRRTHTCGELRSTNVGQAVILNGWVNTYRSYNDQVFIDLRDREGLTQIVIEADHPELFKTAADIRNEWVLAVKGKVRERLPGKHNPKLATGDIEVVADEVHILNRCPTLPFEVTEFPGQELANEDLRLEYRYIDLRRRSLQKVLMARHHLNKVIRDNLSAQGFLEIETPLLGRSTPEGARDYLVPSRVTPGSWYALPQSPQLYKQLLMVAGYDKYFQIARCLRDEDLRADRQPEFTQLDVEMSFVDREDVFSCIEGLVADIFSKCLGVEIKLPFPRLLYEDAMLRYGCDKPDLRYGLEIVDVGQWATTTDFKVFKETIEQGNKVRGLNASQSAEKFSRKDITNLEELVKPYGAKGLAWLKVEADKLTGPIEKFLPAPAQAELRKEMNANPGDLLMFVAGPEKVVCQSLDKLRQHIATRVTGVKDWWVRKAEQEEEALKKKQQPPPFAFQPGDFNLAWVVDFPMFMFDDEEKRWAAIHHPFTAPRDEDLQMLESDPGKVRAKAYDLVLNGNELAGGSIRIHSPEVQSRVFSILGMDETQAKQRFGFLLDALQRGAPPHGGIAFGLDRFAMWLSGTQNIRDVIAFPKNQKARDLMTGAPAPVDKKQLKELGL